MTANTVEETTVPEEKTDFSDVDFDHGVEVTSDTELTGREREFSLTVAHDEKHLHVHCEIPSIIRALLQHPGFVAEAVDVNSGGNLTRVKGRLNMGYLKIRPSRRTSSNIHSQIVNPETADKAAFEEMGYFCPLQVLIHPMAKAF